MICSFPKINLFIDIFKRRCKHYCFHSYLYKTWKVISSIVFRKCFHRNVHYFRSHLCLYRYRNFLLHLFTLSLDTVRKQSYILSHDAGIGIVFHMGFCVHAAVAFYDVKNVRWCRILIENKWIKKFNVWNVINFFDKKIDMK